MVVLMFNSAGLQTVQDRTELLKSCPPSSFCVNTSSEQNQKPFMQASFIHTGSSFNSLTNTGLKHAKKALLSAGEAYKAFRVVD